MLWPWPWACQLHDLPNRPLTGFSGGLSARQAPPRRPLLGPGSMVFLSFVVGGHSGAGSGSLLFPTTMVDVVRGELVAGASPQAVTAARNIAQTHHDAVAVFFKVVTICDDVWCLPRLSFRQQRWAAKGPIWIFCFERGLPNRTHRAALCSGPILGAASRL